MPKYIVEKEQLYISVINNPVHRFDWGVVWCESAKRIEEYCRSIHEGSAGIQTVDSNHSAFFYKLTVDGSFYPVICLPFKWEKTNKQICSVTHEVIHAVAAFFRAREIPLPKDQHYLDSDEENFCYYTDWLLQQILDKLDDQDNHKYALKTEEDYVTIPTEGLQKKRPYKPTTLQKPSKRR